MLNKIQGMDACAALTLCPVIIAMSCSLVKTPSAVSLGGANMVRCLPRQDFKGKNVGQTMPKRNTNILNKT